MLCKKICYFRDAYRLHSIGIHAHIVPPQPIFQVFKVIFLVVMLVPMEINAPLKISVPLRNGVVEENKYLILPGQLIVIPNPL